MVDVMRNYHEIVARVVELGPVSCFAIGKRVLDRNRPFL